MVVTSGQADGSWESVMCASRSSYLRGQLAKLLHL